MLEGKEDDAALWEWVDCGRKRRKQLINQHREETGKQTVEQRWRRTDSDRWGQGGSSLLPLSTQLAVAGRTLCTAVLSLLPLGILSACLSVCPGLGGGSRWCWDMSSNILCVVRPPLTLPLTLQYELPLESKCGYLFVF